MLQAKVVKNIVYLLAASCLTNLSLFSINIILIRYLSKKDFGVFTLLVSIVYMYIAFSELGISQGTIKYISEHLTLGDLEYIRKHIRNFFFATLIISLVFLLFFYLSLPVWKLFYNYLPTGYAVFLALIIFPYPVVRYWNAITDGFQNMKYALFFSVAREPLKLFILLCITLFYHLNIRSAVILFVVSSYITFIFSYLIYRLFLLRANITFEVAMDRDILFDKKKIRYFSYLYVSFLIFWIQPNVLYLIIGKFLNPENVAAFSSCFILNNIMWVFLLPVMDTLFPYISSIYSTRSIFEGAKKKIYFVLFIVITSAFIWVLFVYFFGYKVIAFFYGVKYIIYKNIFYLLSVSLFFDSFRTLFDPMLKGTIHANILLYLELARIIAIIIFGPVAIIYGGLPYLCYLLASLSFVINFIKGFLLGRLFPINILYFYVYAFCLFLILFSFKD